MILVLVGGYRTGFDRLVSACDALREQIDEDIVIQYGWSSVHPVRCSGFAFAPLDRIRALCAEARVIVAHAGSGSILTALDFPARLVLVPRLGSLGDHHDDHQTELAEVIESRGLAVCVHDLNGLTDLATAIEQAPVRLPTPSAGESLRAAIRSRLAADRGPGRSAAAGAHGRTQHSKEEPT